MRSIALSLSALLLPLSLAACGSDAGDDDVAADPAPTSATSGPTESTESTEAASPTVASTVGTYPEFGPTDYTYELTVQCFCLGGNQPMLVTVADDEIASAVWADGAGKGTGGQIVPGAPVEDQGLARTLDEVIAEANDTEAEAVEVDWPAGQDYPTRVSVDQITKAADDEVVFLVADVQVG